MTDAEDAYRAAVAAGDVEAALRAEAAVDAEQAADEARLRAPGMLGRAALWYVEQGIAVFPLSPGSKVPRPGSGGFKDASTDPDRVRAWWDGEPNANIGLPTGLLFDVVDIDAPAGWLSWARLDDPLGGREPLGKALTAGHGAHYYIQPTGRGNTAAIYPGIDFRGLGGYVVAPPSLVDGRRYSWTIPLRVAA